MASYGVSGRRGTRQQRSAGGWASRRMLSSERRTVSTCRHAHRRSAPAARHVRRVRSVGRPSRGLRTPCRSRPCARATSPQPLNAWLPCTREHGVWRVPHGASVRTRAAGRLESQVRRHSASVMIRRRSTCRTATSMHVAPTSLVADATRRMKRYSRNFNEHESAFNVCGAAEATAAARGRRVEARGGPAPPASPLPQPPPGGGRDGSSTRKWRSTCRSSDPADIRAHRDVVTR